ncbi:metallophosphoesterase family protein [Rosettibacter firmus]|uniref:metallophosphoesterase family protein n=1 Tax=Rosettibacter firmus TaxID=3111522 RepID=UPI00336BD49E
MKYAIHKIIFLFFVLNIIINAKTNLPEKIILNLTDTPYNSIAITWQSKQKYSNPQVQFAISTKWIEFKKNLYSVSASIDSLISEDGKITYFYSSILQNLYENTLYVYRVGSDTIWSEWNQFITASKSNQPFKFVYFGDPQNDIREDVSRIFREAFRRCPDASFWLFAGDLTDEPEQSQWDEWFEASGFIHKMIPSIMTVGNHDLTIELVDGKKKRINDYILWKKMFTLPENGLENMKESVYYVDYQGVRFIVLNSNYNLEEQAQWLDKILSSNKNKWTIVTFHHPVYSTGSGRDNSKTRDSFMPIFDKYKVDLVLQGHDHTYARTHKIRNGKVSSSGTVYVTSVSGPKQYDTNPNYKDLLAKLNSYVQLYQVISINNNKLSYKSYTVNGKLFDEFELIK